MTLGVLSTLLAKQERKEIVRIEDFFVTVKELDKVGFLGVDRYFRYSVTTKHTPTGFEESFEMKEWKPVNDRNSDVDYFRSKQKSCDLFLAFLAENDIFGEYNYLRDLIRDYSNTLLPF